MPEPGPDGPPPELPTDIVQMNVRVPRALRDQVDARRGSVGMSRDKWVAAAVRWALRQPVPPANRVPRSRTR